jgi:DNA-binding response OmpR family regulator
MANILIIDDSATVANMLQRFLQKAGHTAAIAPTGAMGLQLVRESIPTLVVLDRVLPDMEGYDVCRSLRGEPSTAKTKVLMLTGTADASVVRSAQAAGIDRLMSKSAGLPSVVDVIQTLLQEEPNA